MAFWQLKVEFLAFKIKTKFCIHNNFQKIGYHSRFYSSLNYEKHGNGKLKKNKVDGF